MEVERTKEFSPVKNAEGENSPATSLGDLCNYYSGWLEKAGVTRDRVDGEVNGKLEISPLFAMDENEFSNKKTADLKFYDGLYAEKSKTQN